MSAPLRSILAAQASRRAKAKGRVGARRVVLVGGVLVAVTIFLERAGLLVVPWMGGAGGDHKVLDWLVVSVAGLVQGALALAAVFGLAILVRATAPLFLRPRLSHVAREIDTKLSTDRYTSALEATGPLAELAVRHAAEKPPPPQVFAMPSRRGERWLRRFVLLLVLIVALVPGKAPAEDGGLPPRPVGGEEEHSMVLRLVGEKEVIPAGEPIPLQVILECPAAPATDLSFKVALRIDGGEDKPTTVALFLPAGAPGQDAQGLDLAPYAKELKPGDHVAVARAGLLLSNEYRFRIEPPPGGENEQPKESPPPPNPPPSRQPQGGGPQETKPKYVEPLVRGDDTRKKLAKVPIEVPEGGGGPQEKPIAEAWPELERRREEALNRPGLSPAARKLVREYFELLRPEGK